jgi:hypothetical protein
LTLAICACLHAPQVAVADAATKAREGDVNQWIEYYRRDRSPERPARPSREDSERPPVNRQPAPDCSLQNCAPAEQPREPVR